MLEPEPLGAAGAVVLLGTVGKGGGGGGEPCDAGERDGPST